MNTLAIPPPRALDEEIVGVPEIADIGGVTPAAVNTWRYRDHQNPGKPLFPTEDDSVGSFPVWRVDRVTAWFDATGRPYDLKRWRKKKAAGGYRRPKHVMPPKQAKAKSTE